MVDRDTPRRELRAYLTGTQLVREKDSYRTQSTPYDPTSTDVDYIINMMMFHEGCRRSWVHWPVASVRRGH